MKKTKDVDTNSVNEIISISKKILKLVYVVLILLLIIAGIYICREMKVVSLLLSILDILMPLFIGFIIAWIFSPLVNKMESKGLSRLGGSLIVYAGLIVLFAVFISLFVPVIFNQITEFVAYLPSVVNSVMDFVNNFLDNLALTGMDVENIKTTVNESLNTFSSDLASSLPQTAFNVASSFFSGTIDFVFSLILGLYILIDFNRIKKTMIKFVPIKNQLEISKLLTDIGYEARKTVHGILLIASMVFVCDTIGFAIIGLEASLLIGLFCGITDLIPYIGPYIGGGVAVLVGFSQGPIVGIGVLIIALLVQAIENYVLQPVVMSKATNIHPIIIMISLLLFGYFFGIIGMILSTPILSIGKVIFIHFNNKYNIFDKVSLNS